MTRTTILILVSISFPVVFFLGMYARSIQEGKNEYFSDLNGLLFPKTFLLEIEDVDETIAGGSFEISNPTSQSIEISEITKSCSCADLSVEFPFSISPGENRILPFSVNIPKEKTNQSVSFKFVSGGKSLTTRGFVTRKAYFWVSPSVIDIGSILHGTTVEKKFKVNVSASLKKNLRFSLNCNGLKCVENEDGVYSVTVDSSRLPPGRFFSEVQIHGVSNAEPRSLYIKGNFIEKFGFAVTEIQDGNAGSGVVSYKAVVFRNDEKAIENPKITFDENAGKYFKEKTEIDHDRLTLFFNIKSEQKSVLVKLLFPDESDTFEFSLSGF